MELFEQTQGRCLSRIQAIADTKQKGTIKIVRYLLAHPKEAASLTISELTKKVDTSIATVSRFCTRLGYENYRTFQIDLAASLMNNASPVSDIIHPDDKPATIIKRVFEINRQSLNDTETMSGNEVLFLIAKLIIRAEKVFLLGIGGSGLIAKLGALRFESLGKTALAISDPYDSLLALSSAARNDVVFGISHTGRSGLIIKMLQLAKNKGTKTIGITNYADSPLAKMSDFRLLTSFRERRVNAAVSSSRIAQLCILDALYFLTAYHQGSKAEKLALQVEKAAEQLFRVNHKGR
jgi:RpiR family transcriptional regulator, carbohydrate utilization regulator